jgi:hypothetical protein
MPRGVGKYFFVDEQHGGGGEEENGRVGVML